MDEFDSSMTQVDGQITDVTIDPQDVVMTDGEVGLGENFDLGSSYFTFSEQVLKSLDLTDVQGKGSLYKLLHKCSTKQGSRLLLQWISHPLTNRQDIENRLDLVEFFVTNSALRATVADIHLMKFPDIVPVLKKLERKRVTLQDLYKVYVAVKSIPALVSTLQLVENVTPRTKQLLEERFIVPLNGFFDQLKNYQVLISETIDLNHIQRTGEYRIRPNVSEKLRENNEESSGLVEEMDRDWDDLASVLGMEKEKVLKFDRDAKLGYLYRVTCKEEKQLRAIVDKEKLKLTKVDTKQSGYRFRTETLDELNERYLVLVREYQELQGEVITELVETAATYAEPLTSLNTVLAPLDVITSLAKTAFEAIPSYTRPVILEKEAGIIDLKDSRHPCMESFLHCKDFIPNSVRFEHDKETFHIVTGPNMGGKSTYIRQIALNVVLAQMGSFVPCSSATVSIVDGIYTRIGAGDSVLKGVSTFMMEMLETQEILKSATKYSLIIIDELGRGTSTYDGYGLAYAIAEHIAVDLGSYCLLTTHFNELAELKKHVKTVVVSHVTALVSEEDGIIFQYAVEPGVCSQSFGINVAQIAGISSGVIEEAKKILEELESAHKVGVSVVKS